MKTFLFLSAILGCLLSFAREKKLVLHHNGKVQYEYEMEGFLMDGKFACYYENGKLKVKGQFSANQKSGVWRFWDEKGVLRVERNYTDEFHFTVLSQKDSAGNRLKVSLTGIPLMVSGPEDIVSSTHLNLRAFDSAVPENKDLFEEQGLAGTLLSVIRDKSVSVYKNDKLTQPAGTADFSQYATSDIISIYVKEEYALVNAYNPALANCFLALCPVVLEKGVRKELGWVSITETLTTEQLKKMINHQYKSIILKSTIHDPAFRLKDVAMKDNESLRLMLLEFESEAIIYSQEQNSSLATNQ